MFVHIKSGQQTMINYNVNNSAIHIPYILAYKSKNFGQIFALKVGGSTYRWVIKNIFAGRRLYIT